MKVKSAITIALLLFVAASIVSLVVRQSTQSPEASADTVREIGTGGADLPADGLIVYYFHGNARCPTCITLEEYSKGAVEEYFADQLQSGRIRWQTVNFDETMNGHYFTNYDLSVQSLVLVEIKDGKEVGFSNLERIWDLVGDKAGYFEYVREEIDRYLASENPADRR